MTRYINADELDSVVLRMNEEGAQITRGEYKLIDCVIFNFPTVKVKPVIHGKWVHYKDEHACSKCGEAVTGDWDEDYDYCPHCGARMDLDDA